MSDKYAFSGIRKIVLWAVVILLNILLMIFYSGDLGLGWMLVLMVSPLLGFIISMSVFFMFRFILSIDLKREDMLKVNLVSCLIAFVLPVVGMLFHPVSSVYDYFIDKTENGPVQRVGLGNGKTLIFKNAEQENFELNFDYLGKKQVSRAYLIGLIKDYCAREQCSPGEIFPMHIGKPFCFKKGFGIECNDSAVLYVTVYLRYPQGYNKRDGRYILKLVYTDNRFSWIIHRLA